MKEFECELLKPQIEEFIREKDLIVTAKLYAEVFAAPPWNEVWRCESCDRFYGPEYSKDNPSPCCSTPLTTAYPEEETTNYIIKELSKPEAQIKLSRAKNEQLIAFAWGYQICNAEKLATEKWPQSKEIQLKVIQYIATKVNPSLPLYYISEVGVSYQFRGNGIGSQLTKNLLDYGLNLKQPTIFRTNWASPMVSIARKLGMQQIMGPCIKIENGQTLKGGIVNFIDENNPDRALFIKSL